MQHRIENLLRFLASEYSETEEGVSDLLSEPNLIKACGADNHKTVQELKLTIYFTYESFGFEHAKGVFEVTVVSAFKEQAA